MDECGRDETDGAIFSVSEKASQYIRDEIGSWTVIEDICEECLKYIKTEIDVGRLGFDSLHMCLLTTDEDGCVFTFNHVIE